MGEGGGSIFHRVQLAHKRKSTISAAACKYNFTVAHNARTDFYHRHQVGTLCDGSYSIVRDEHVTDNWKLCSNLSAKMDRDTETGIHVPHLSFKHTLSRARAQIQKISSLNELRRALQKSPYGKRRGGFSIVGCIYTHTRH